MENQKTPYDVQAEQIKSLFKKTDTIEKKVDKIEGDRGFMHKLDKTLAVQAEMLKSIVEHMKKQDERNDRQDERLESQQEFTAKISLTLTQLTDRFTTLDDKMGSMESKLREHSEKGKIDIIPILRDILMKFMIPSGVLVALYEIAKFLKDQ